MIVIIEQEIMFGRIIKKKCDIYDGRCLKVNLHCYYFFFFKKKKKKSTLL
jgi:hypothetical protein